MKKQDLSEKTIDQNLLRLWPGVVAVGLQWLIRFVIPIIVPGDMASLIGVFAGFLGGVAVIVWWAFFSRAPKIDRWLAITLMIISLLITPKILHESIVTGNLGMMYMIYSIPVLSLAFVVWALASRRLTAKLQRVTMVATILLACGFWTFLRCDGISGGGTVADFTWRWSETSEEILLAQDSEEPTAVLSASDTPDTRFNWPGFRGSNRDGIIHGIQIKTDWSESPPKEMWRRQIGPGCSSFAVLGELFYTQEQRGDEEMVSCYNLNTGEPVWRHGDGARFWEIGRASCRERV